MDCDQASRYFVLLCLALHHDLTFMRQALMHKSQVVMDKRQALTDRLSR